MDIDQHNAEAQCTCGSLPDYSAQIAIQRATEEVNKAKQALAKLPEDAIAKVQEAIQKLMKIINGWEDTSSPTFDPDKVISQIEALLNPVVNSLCSVIDSIGLPKIPGLTDIAELLSKLGSMKKSEYQTEGNLPDIPPELMQTLTDLLAAIQALMITLPTVCVQILFNTVDLILSTGIPVVGMNFYTIIGMVPYVKEIPQLVQLAPKITDLVTNMGGKLSNAVTGKIKQQLKAIDDLQVPQPPPDIEPIVPTVCPIHGVAK